MVIELWIYNIIANIQNINIIKNKEISKKKLREHGPADCRMNDQ